MKKVYTGLKAEKIDFGAYDSVIKTSLPPGCLLIVSNTVLTGTQVCHNPTDTTAHMYYGDHPIEWD